MNAERHAQIRRLFLAAHERSAAEVEAFLEQACAGDAELRREVQSLLAHAGSPPQPAATDDAAADDAGGPLHERFPPGTIIAGRYRMLGPLGRGGMGEVYRADDLKLDHAVALKFLTRALAGNPAGRGSLLTEVKLARKVSHPNVARVYDIGEAHGELFISMEFIDGEDLASLLRRVGRLTGDKILQVAQELCLGLGAAHDRGVLHRDLKPANVMLDGDGHVRITDFGIAAMQSTVDRETRVSGTPGFMAPELFAGKPASIRSDLYAMGMVLYEAATGQEPFHGVPPYDRHVEDRPTVPSLICDEIDPALERVTLECLQTDPRRRPESAYAVAAALPQCDPLAASVAAGVTPSPNQVAAGGAHRVMRRGPALACLASVLAGLLAVVLLAGRTFFLPQAGLTKPPAVLAEKAREVIHQLGYSTRLEGSLQGFTIDRDYLRYRMAVADRHRRWDDLATGRPPAVFFWYCEGRARLLPPPVLGEPRVGNDLPGQPGTTAVRLDAQGRLLEFAAWPPRSASPDDGVGEPDWTDLFQRAGLDVARFHGCAPAQPPPMYADRVRGWEGAAPERPEVGLRVEGASLGRRVVYFNLIEPWDQTAEILSALTSASDETPSTFVAHFVLYLLVLVVGSTAAWHNVGLGRSDLQGARRLAWFVFGLGLFQWLLGEQHAAGWIDEAKSFYLGTARAALTAGAMWICYLAMEPSVRRFWPQTMITWSRLLTGRFRDPLLGRDLLLGGILGVGLVLIMQADSLVPQWLHRPLPLPKLPQRGYELGELLGARYKLGVVASTLLAAVATGLALVLAMTLLRIILRNRWLSALAACLFLALYFSVVAMGDTYQPWLTHGLSAIVFFLVLTRVGLVAVVAGLFVKWMLLTAPLTANQHAWYAPSSNFALVVLIALAGYSFFTALGGQPFLGHRWLDGD
jgi:serine/threonine-protein kinase